MGTMPGTRTFRASRREFLARLGTGQGEAIFPFVRTIPPHEPKYHRRKCLCQPPIFIKQLNDFKARIGTNDAGKLTSVAGTRPFASWLFPSPRA